MPLARLLPRRLAGLTLVATLITGAFAPGIQARPQASDIRGQTPRQEPKKCKTNGNDKKACEVPQTTWWEGWSMDDPRLSQPTFTESVIEDLTITASDGVTLDARVIRPVIPEGMKIPAIMHLSPYLPNDMAQAKILPDLQKHRYVERGYALVGVSLRGFGSSGGCIDYQGERDREDINAILDTIAAQPWSNGKVGGIGLSWDGTSLNAAALSGNPHLATVVPAAAITDWYKWSYMQGIPVATVGHSFSIYAGPAVWLVLGGGIPPEHAAARACEGAAESVVVQEQTALTGERNEWWDERDLIRYTDQINPELAILQVQGLPDIGVRADMLHDWDPRMRELLPNYRLLAGHWGHMWPDTPDIPAFSNPDLEFNRHPLTSWPVILLRWFDQWLKDKDTGIMAMPGALVQDQLGQWHEEDALTPTRGIATSLYPAPDGALGSQPSSGELSFIDNGLGVDPRGTCVYMAIGWFVGCAPAEQPNAHFFATEPYAEETRFSGVVEMDLRLSHSTPTGQVGVTLYDVGPERWKPLSYGISSLNLRDGDEYNFQPIDPGAEFDHRVELVARDIVLPAGHRLGLAIGSQVDGNVRGLTGNGFWPNPSGGQTTMFLGQPTRVVLNQLPGPTKIIPLP